MLDNNQCSYSLPLQIASPLLWLTSALGPTSHLGGDVADRLFCDAESHHLTASGRLGRVILPTAARFLLDIIDVLRRNLRFLSVQRGNPSLS